MKNDLESVSLDKEREWLKTYTLSSEQVRQLMLNKFERAKKDQENLEKTKHLL